VSHERAQALRRRINSRGQASRAGTNHDQVEVAVAVEVRADTICVRKLWIRGVHQDTAVMNQNDRQVGVRQPGLGKYSAAGRTVARMEQVQNAIANQETAQLMGALQPSLSHHGQLPFHHGSSPLPLQQELSDGAMEVL